MRFSALNALFLWLSVSVSVAPENSFTPSYSELDLDTPPQLSQKLPLKQIIAQNISKKALVIGNGAYEVGRLRNPVNDANGVANTLRELGFEVDAPTNLNLGSMHDEIEGFGAELTQGGVGLFYYAGHGVEVDGNNYLIPVNAQLKRENDVYDETYPLRRVIGIMESAKTRTNILIIDACRDNPFYRRWGSNSRGLTAIRGIEAVEATQGWIIAFSTAPGDVAEDGVTLGNSPFTYYLLRHLKNPNENIIDMLVKVRKDVYKATNQRQFPWWRNGLLDPFYFNPVTVNPLPEPPTTDSSFLATLPPLYSQLQNLLSQARWRKADEVTWSLLHQLGDQEPNSWLSSQEILNLSCSDLNIIDKLWSHYSNKRFGLSIQRQIYESVRASRLNDGSAYRRFALEVGHKTGTDNNNLGYLGHNDLNFSLNAPIGHLPVGGDPKKLVGFRRDLSSRLASCQIAN